MLRVRFSRWLTLTAELTTDTPSATVDFVSGVIAGTSALCEEEARDEVRGVTVGRLIMGREGCLDVATRIPMGGRESRCQADGVERTSYSRSQ